MRRRKLVINLVPLLDILAIMIFGIFIQSQAVTRQGLKQKREEIDKNLQQERERASTAERTADQRADQLERMKADLKEMARQSTNRKSNVDRLEDEIRALAAELAEAKRQLTPEEKKQAEERALASARENMEFATALQKAFGLNEEQIKEASKSLPRSPTNRKKMLDELRNLSQANQNQLPGLMQTAPEFSKQNDAYLIFLQSDGKIVITLPDGTELGNITDYTTPEDVQTKLGKILEPAIGDKKFVYILLSWSKVLESKWNIVTRGVTGEIDFLKLRPQNEGKQIFLILTGYSPDADRKVLPK